MRLVVIRHAKAEERGDRWPDDSLRPLSEKGIADFREAAKGLAKIVTPDIVMTSPFVRAMQTAQVLHEAAGWPEPRTSESLADGSAQQLVAALAAQTEQTLAIVGHEPTLSSLISLIATGSPSGSIRMSPGAAALIELYRDALPELSGELIWLAQPKMARRMA